MPASARRCAARREIRHERRANHRRARRGAVPASRQRHRHAGRAPAAPALRGPAGRSRRRRPDLSAGRHRRRAVGLAPPAHADAQARRRRAGPGAEATVWASGERLPLASAVMLNAYQVFNQEFDAIHDRAVVHAFACIAPAALGYAEREGGVDGRRLITAVAAGLDFAIHVALAQRAPMLLPPRHVRRAGRHRHAVQARRPDEAATRDALGSAYSHLSGTMQAHIEGSARRRPAGRPERARRGHGLRAGARRLSRPARHPGGRSATSRCTTPARRAGTKSPATSAAYSRSRA